MDFTSSALYGKKITKVSISLHKFGGIDTKYLTCGKFLSMSYYPQKIVDTGDILLDLCGVDLELDSEEIRLKYETASYNFRRFLQLTGM